MKYRNIAATVLKKMITNKGDDIYYLSGKNPVLIVFLRNFGCMFCREAMEDISKIKNQIIDRGVEIVMVHMSDFELGEKFLKKFKLDDLRHISDPEAEFYQAFGLMRGNFNQLFGFQNWIRGFDVTLLKGHGIALPVGDGFQMPGIFLLNGTRIENSYIHQKISDRPDYFELCEFQKQEIKGA
jgi:hypothetical protein